MYFNDGHFASALGMANFVFSEHHDKATPEVRISSDATARTVRVWVEDNGIGIQPDALESVFKLFRRDQRASGYEGTGIGLAIVRKAVQRMGGHVGVESEVGKGSRFWVELSRAG
jgi:signal transduction histidine kinase